MSGLRRAAVAGSWYPDDPRQLAAAVDGYVARADVEAMPGPIRAVIAPHAGLMYSGSVAAFAYKAAAGAGFSAVVMIGPSHFVPFEGISIWPDGAWGTPFGEIEVDGELAAGIASHSAAIVELPAAHRREHSLEMHLPFVARLLPGAAIVPLVMGRQTRETAFAAGDAMARAVRAREDAEGGRVLLAASSDLSHYEPAPAAARLDGVVIEQVSALDAAGLMSALEREPRHACGGGPMVAALHAARQLGARGSQVLHYADSGDVSGDKSSVVGYMAAAIWGGAPQDRKAV